MQYGLVFLYVLTLPFIDKLVFIEEESRKYIKQNKFLIGVAIFLSLNYCYMSIQFNGAFELDLDGKEAWSRLKSRTIPVPNDLIELLNKMGLSRINGT